MFGRLIITGKVDRWWKFSEKFEPFGKLRALVRAECRFHQVEDLQDVYVRAHVGQEVWVRSGVELFRWLEEQCVAAQVREVA